MTALAQLVGGDQAAALARLQLELATAPPPAAEPLPTLAVCPTCGQPRPAPPALFRPADLRRLA